MAFNCSPGEKCNHETESWKVAKLDYVTWKRSFIIGHNKCCSLCEQNSVHVIINAFNVIAICNCNIHTF